MPEEQSKQQYNDFMMAINPMIRQLDRLEERTRDIVTRTDLEVLRKELVARDSLEPQLVAFRAQLARVDTDRTADKAALEKRIEKLEAEQISRQDRLWIRLGQIMAVAAFALAVFQFLSHLKLTP